MEQEIIDVIVDLAVHSFAKNVQPGEYAKIAAHKAAYMSAFRHYPELADFAALSAATEFLPEVLKAIKFSARVADAAALKLVSDGAYHTEWENYSTTALPVQYTQKHYFLSLTEPSEQAIQVFSETMTPAYEKVSVQDVVARNKAKRAALYVYIPIGPEDANYASFKR